MSLPTTYKVLISPQLWQHLLLFVFSDSHPTRCEMVSRCGFALWFPNDYHADHLFMGFFTIHRSSLVKCLFKYFVLPPSPVLLFLLSRREDSIYILGTSHLPDMYFADIFSQSAACLHFRIVFFEVQRFSILKRSALSTFKVILYFWYPI